MRPVLLAAALVALFAVPACSSVEEPAPIATPAVTPPSTTATEAAPDVDTTPGWAERRTDHADLDGDGRKEEVGYGGEYGPIRLRVLPALLPAVDRRIPAGQFPGELPPSECGPSEVSPVRIPGGPGGSAGWLVMGPGCAESSPWEIYVEVDGEWVAAGHPARPFLGEGIEEKARGHDELRAWVTEDGRLYSTRGPLGGARRQLWQWTLDGAVVRPTYLGRVCFDPVDEPRRYGPC